MVATQALIQLRQRLKNRDWLKQCLNAGRQSASWPAPSTSSAPLLVEFSSPNIAKPFHVGHLRSTLTGDFIASLLATSGHPVQRLTFLGDFGSQFGLLLRGLADQTQLCQQLPTLTPTAAVAALYHVYVAANQRAQDETDFAQDARQLTEALETGQSEATALREEICRQSRLELERLFADLRVVFHRWDAESQYAASAPAILARLSANGLLVERDGAAGLLDPAVRKETDNFLVLQKSDKSSLYLTRDVSAALHRLQRSSPAPELLIYVVDQSQKDHFRRIRLVLEAMGEEEAASKIHHIPFGRVSGMSSRKGNAILLEEVLSNGREKARELILSSKTRKVQDGPELEAASVELSRTALRIAELRRKRRSNYEFSWDRALRMSKKGGSLLPTGALLQYRHARLETMTRKAAERLGVSLELDADWPSGETIDEAPEAQALLHHCLAFPDALSLALAELESHHFTDFTFLLLKLTGHATEKIRILDDNNRWTPEEAKSRLLLFLTAKELLVTCMSLLNVQPMDRL